MRYLLFIAIVSCAMTDTLDGHIDNERNCCAALTTSRVRRCMVKFMMPGECREMFCQPPVGRVQAYLSHDGEVSDCLPPEEQPQ